MGDFDIKIGIQLSENGKELKDQWSKLKQQLENDKIKINLDFGKNIQDMIKPIIQASNELNNLQKQVNMLSNNKNDQIIDIKEINQIKDFKGTIDEIKQKLTSLGEVKFKSGTIDDKGIQNYIATIKKANGEILQLKYQFENAFKDKGNEVSIFKFDGIKSIADGTNSVFRQVDKFKLEYQNKINSIKQVGLVDNNKVAEFENQLNGLDIDNFKNSIDSIKNNYKDLQTESNNLIKIQQQVAKESQQLAKETEKANQQIQDAISKSNKLREQESKILEEKQSKASNKGLDENYNNIQKFVSQSENQLNKLQEKFKGLYSNLEFTKIRDEFNNLLPSDSDLNSKFNNINEKIKQFDGVLSERSRIQSLGNSIGSFSTTGLNLGSSVSEIQTYLKSVETGKVQFNQLSESVDKANNRVKQIHYTVDQGNGLFQKYTLNVDSASGSVYKLDRGIIDATSHQKSFGDTLKSALESVTGFSLISGAYFTTISAIKDMIVYTGQMDNALTDLNKVVDLSKSQLDDMKQSALELGEALGKDSVSVMASMGEAGRQFKDTEDIKKFTETAVMASNVTDMSAQQATKSLTTVMKVFKQNINDVQGDLDSFNEIQNNFRKKLCGSKTFSNGLGSLVIRRQGASVMVA